MTTIVENMAAELSAQDRLNHLHRKIGGAYISCRKCLALTTFELIQDGLCPNCFFVEEVLRKGDDG